MQKVLRATLTTGTGHQDVGSAVRWLKSCVLELARHSSASPADRDARFILKVDHKAKGCI